MKKINFENGTLVSPAIVNEDNTITPAQYEGNTPISAYMLNLMQDNIEKGINARGTSCENYIDNKTIAGIYLLNSITASELAKALKTEIGKLMHPIGSIYMSVENINPSTLFGGTWVAWGSGRVPVRS